MAGHRVIPVTATPPARAGLRSLPPLSLYVHTPWCTRKCPYCDFNSHAARGPLPEEEYLAALVADLEYSLPRVWGRRVGSIFIGGGTPSLLQPATVDALLAAVRARLVVAPDAEITMEANPGSADTARLADFRAAGVNRLSLGVQSFDDRALAALGRIHDGQDAARAVDAAVRLFDQVNLDLIYALPGQGLDHAQCDVDRAIASGVTHVSAYQLTLEPNTPFHRHPPPLPDPDLAADMQDMLEERLGAAGYGHYEISAFARQGSRCRHNLNYWRFGDYLGIGAGAHGKLSFPDRIEREARVRGPGDYMDRAGTERGIQVRRIVAADELPFEFMMNAMRLVEGWSPDLYPERTGRPWSDLSRRVAKLVDADMIEIDTARIAPTRRGRNLLNDLLAEFLPDTPLKGLTASP